MTNKSASGSRTTCRRAVLLAATIAGGLSIAQAARAAEINFWVTEPGKDRAVKLVKDFEAANPDIKVNLQSNPYGGLQGKVLVALRSGIPPDVIEVQTSWLSPYVATGKLDDITDVVTSKIPVKDFVPAPIENSTFDGKIYSLPFQAESLAMLYRKDLYREAGLDPDKPPVTWPAFIEAAKKLTRTRANGQATYGYGIAGGGPEGEGNVLYRALPYMWMNGGGILSDDYKKVIINSPESVAAVDFYTSMYTQLKVAPPSTLENDGLALRRLFMAGTIAQYQGTPTEIERLDKDAPDLDYGVAIMPHPEGKQTAALLGGWGFILPKDAKNKEAAKKLIAFLANPERIGFYTRTFPTVKAALDLPRFADPRFTAFKEMLNYARPQPPIDSWARITSIFYRNIQEILVGGSTPQQAMDKAAKDITALVK